VARPAHLGAGLVAAVLVPVLPVVFDLARIHLTHGPAMTTGWGLYRLLGGAIIGVAVAVVRGNASRTPG
jgi:hypothetical protein